MSNNHVNDPTYFLDAIRLFGFWYDAYVVDHEEIDKSGNVRHIFAHTKIYGSLQSQGRSLRQDFTGNTEEWTYKFYCSSMYRFNIGDFIKYNNKWLHCDQVQDYDEWGVREGSFTMVELTGYKDFQEYLNYLKGDEII